MRFVALAIALLTLLVGACGDSDEGGSNVTEARASSSPAEEEAVTPPPTRRPSPTHAPTPVPEIREITIERFGFSVNDDGDRVSWGAVLRNAAARTMGANIDVQVGFYDAGGTVVGSASGTVAAMFPGEVTATADSTSVNGIPAEMRVQVLPGDWQEATGISPLGVRNVVFSRGQYFGLDVTGEVVSAAVKDLEDVRIVALYLGAGGNIVGGSYTYQDFVPAGGSAAFKVTGFDDVPGAVSAEAYAQPSYLTLSALD